MKRIYLFLTVLTMTLCSAMAQTGDPIFTFGCLSDIHSQESMISASDVSNVKLRTAFTTSLQKIKAKEKVDALVLGGDYTSDVTISETNWQKVRSLMGEAVLTAFPSTATRTPVIYTVGNHDFEVANFDNLPKGYVAGDFYSYPMKGQTGYLAPNECFYETAENGTGDPVSLLAAYHYQIKGFDFVVLNCGKYFFKSAWDYQDSQESVDWVAAKLNEIDPDGKKTIFFINHLPLPNSVGATANKCLTDNTATQSLVTALAKHPGIVYLYGHDHSSTSNMSYITDKVSQRVTHYDSNGTIMTESSSSDGVSSAYIQSYADQTKYLTYDATNNLHLETTPATATISAGSADNTFYIYVNGYTMHCGTSAYFSGNSDGSKENARVYEVDPSTLKGTRVSTLEYGKTYAIAEECSKSGYTGWWAVSNEDNGTSGNGHRMKSCKVTEDESGNITLDDTKYLWTLVDPSASGTPSFYSCFMGSMRYNNLDTNSSPGTDDSPIIQALIVRVYSDGIKLDMQNYGETGALSGTVVSPTIADPLEAFTISRTTVKASDITYTVTVTGADEGRVIYNGTEYKNGETFTTNYTISDEELSIKTVEAYPYTTMTIGDGGAITLTYSDVKPTITYTVSCATDGGGVIYDEKEYKNGDKIVVEDEISESDLTAIALEGYKDGEVSLKDKAITVAYYENLFTEGKAYNVALKSAPEDSYGKYLDIDQTSGSQALRSTEAKEVYFTYAGSGKWKLNSAIEGKGMYLGGSTWNAQASTTAIEWTVAKTDNGYTFNQTTTANTGHLGVDKDSQKFYCNKGATYFDVTECTIFNKLIEEDKAFTVALKTAHGETYGSYLTLPSSGSAKRSTTQQSLFFKYIGSNWYYINTARDMSGKYLGAGGWDATVSSTPTAWKIAETDDGYTFNQISATYTGYLGVDDDKESYYCNKSATYFDIAADSRADQFKEGFAYNVYAVESPDSYGKYLDLNVTEALAVRATEPVAVYFKYMGEGLWQLNAKSDYTGSWLGHDGYNAWGTATPIQWTITKTDDGYTLSHTGDNAGLLGLDANKTKFYVDKATGTSTKVYFNIDRAILDTRTTATNSYGTICLPYDATVEGAVILAFSGRSEKGLVFDFPEDKTEETSTDLKAGVPYLYRATADAQTFRTNGTIYTAATPVKNFTGSYKEVDLSVKASEGDTNYFLYTSDNMFHPAGSYVHMGAYRCYFPTLPQKDNNTQQTARSCVFGVYGDEATGIQGINTSVDLNKDGKFINNGRVVIVKNGKKFNVAGQAVK